MNYLYDINYIPVFKQNNNHLVMYLPLYDSFLKFKNGEHVLNDIKNATSNLDVYNKYVGSGARNIVLNITNKCNLACSYCWANSSPNSSLFMEPKTATSIVQASFKNYKINRVHFMGGEPTQNFPTIHTVYEFIKNNLKENPIFYITTNGVIEKSQLNWLLKNNFVFTVSIDTSNSIHADSRLSANGESFISETLKTIIELVRNKSHFRVRITVNKRNQDDIIKTVEELGNLGVKFIHIEKMSTDGRAKEYSKQNDIDNKSFHDIFFDLIDITHKYDMGLMNSSLTNLFNPTDYFCHALKSKTLNFNSDGSISHCYKANNNLNKKNKDFIVGEFEEYQEKININLPRSNFLSDINKKLMSNYTNSGFLYFWSGGCAYKSNSTEDENDIKCEESYHLNKIMLTSAIQSIYEYSLQSLYSPLEGHLWFYEKLSENGGNFHANDDKLYIRETTENNFEIIPLVKKFVGEYQVEACDICI